MKKNVFGLLIAVLMVSQFASASLYEFGFETDPTADGWATFGGSGLTLTPGHSNDGRTVMILNNYDSSSDVKRGISQTFSLDGQAVTELKVNLTFSCNTLRGSDIDLELDLGAVSLNMIHQPWENVNGAVLLVPEYVRPATGPVFTKYAYYQAEFVIDSTGATFNLIEDATGTLVATYDFSGITLADVGSSVDVYVSNITRPWYVAPDGRRGTTAQSFVDNIEMTVPEPATMSLLSLGGLIFLKRKK